VIYFIHDKFSGHIKIGQCWGDKGPRQALTNAQGGNPRQLVVIAVLNHIPFYDEISDEPDLSVDWIKAKFRKHKVRLSWFEAKPILEWLNSKCARRFLIPDYNFIPKQRRYRKTAG
jgi:hypothetical protein